MPWDPPGIAAQCLMENAVLIVRMEQARPAVAPNLTSAFHPGQTVRRTTRNASCGNRQAWPTLQQQSAPGSVLPFQVRLKNSFPAGNSRTARRHCRARLRLSLPRLEGC